jgi:DNA polymerase III epsilon subunit-like protein
VSNNSILIIDTETGGLDHRVHSLLTVGLLAYDIKSRETLDELHLRVKREVYNVTAFALKLNKIDLVKHHNDKEAVSAEQAVGKIIDFIKKNFKKIPVVPGGHNYVDFDKGYIKQLFFEAGADYEDFFSHRCIDTMCFIRFAASLGLVPDKAASLGGAREHFGIKQPRAMLHHALGDCQATAMLFGHLADLVDQREVPEPEEDSGEDSEEKVEEKPARKAKKKVAKKTTKKAAKKSVKKTKKTKKVEEEPEESEVEDIVSTFDDDEDLDDLDFENPEDNDDDDDDDDDDFDDYDDDDDDEDDE